MTDSTSKPGGPKAGADAGAVRNAGRRRLLQAGIAAAPVVMTVASRPVLATTVPAGTCVAPSGFISGNVSSVAGGTCVGLTPGFWKQDQKFPYWQAPYYPTTASGHTATKFKNMFSPSTIPDTSPVANLTMLCVMDPGCGGAPSGPPFDVARHIVAAVLNNAANFVPEAVLPKATIKDIWTQYANTTVYTFGSTTWGGGQIIEYLTSTMDGP